MLGRLRIDTGVGKTSNPPSAVDHLSAGDEPLGLSPAHAMTSRLRSISNASSISSGSLITPVTSSTNASSTSLELAPNDESNGLATPASPAFDDTIRAGYEYVLALHDYDPVSESATCLSFKAGQVIRVYNRDASGWWDGELDGRRGWFPSNFVCSQNDSLTNEKPPGMRKRHKRSLSINSVTSWAGSFRSVQDNGQADDPLLDPLDPDGDASCHPLMVPLLHALSLLQSAIRADRRSHYSPSTACVISCVRSVLSATDCLQRDAEILQEFEQLARVRKEMLETLAFLVGQAKAASEEDVDEEVLRNAVHGMLLHGGQIFESVRRFLTVAVQCGIELPEGQQDDSPALASVGKSIDKPIPPRHEKSDSDSSAVPLLPGRSNAASSARLQQYIGYRHPDSSRHRPSLSISSSSSSNASSIESPLPSPSPPSFPVGPASAVQVLDALRTTHDEYLSTIAAFIGFAHSYSRLSHASSTGHMYELVRDVVDRVCKLLSIVEAVIAYPDIPIDKIPRLRSARDSLYNVTSSLADSVRFLAPNKEEPSSNGMTEEDERQALISSATNALRAGADCVAAVKMCLIRLASEPRSTPFRIEVPSSVGPSGSEPSPRILATPVRVTPVSPRKSNSTSALKQRTLTVDDADEEVTIQIQKPTPIRRVRRNSSSSEKTDKSSVTSKRSVETALTSPDDTKPLAPLSVTSSHVEPPLKSPTSLYSRTDDGTTWEGSIRSPLENKIMDGRLPSLPHAQEQRSRSSHEGPVTWSFSHDYALDEVAYNSEGHLVGATLGVLVEKLTPHDSIVDPAFCAVFFMTFRLFSTPLELMDSIIIRYNLTPPPALAPDAVPYWQHQKGLPVRLRISNLLKLWLETYWRPGVDDEALDVIYDFTEEMLLPLFRGPAQRVLELVEVRRQTSQLVISPKGERIRDPGMSINPPPMVMSGSSSEIPRPIMTKALLNSLRNKNYASILITDFDPLELARQLTVMECHLYCAIKPEEILETGNSKKSFSSIKAMSTLSTTITGWVAESILNEPDTKKRTTLVKFFIKLADVSPPALIFIMFRNLLAFFECSAAQHYKISVLLAQFSLHWIPRQYHVSIKLGMQNVPQKNKNQLEQLRRLADHSRNYHEYRSRLRNTAPAAVPFLGLYLTDVTFCREGNPSHRASPVNPSKKLLNFNKYHKLARIVQDMQRFQVPVQSESLFQKVQSYLEQAFKKAEHHGDLQDLYRPQSARRNPRQAADVPPPTGDVTRQLFGWVSRDRSHSQAQAPA
ncbi:ras guanine nucleotide exchange factor domain-containing protein [Flagelloscypha sp. PMI_526]|nr:ras guanine nucleotide exchange factor domain-containing protein [Flagelloscypha sp. PMI_526]